MENGWAGATNLTAAVYVNTERVYYFFKEDLYWKKAYGGSTNGPNRIIEWGAGHVWDIEL